MLPNFSAGMLVCAMLVLAAAELMAEYMAMVSALTLGMISFLILSLCLIRQFSLREWLLFGLALILTMSFIIQKGSMVALSGALERAAFFAAFIFLVTLLKEAAERSQSVRDLGLYLTQQPKGRRYYVLASGGHMMGILLNFGAVSLLTPLIQKGARAASDDPQVTAIAEQQQISALVRGFAWMIMWSPTALTQAVLLTSFPSINVGFVTLLGLLASVTLIVVGRIEDRIRWRGSDHDVFSKPASFPRSAAKRFFVVCAALIGLTILFALIFNKSGAIALMLAAPLIMFAWIYQQTWAKSIMLRVALTLNCIWDILLGSSHSLGRNSFLLGTAAFIGEMGAMLTPVDRVAESLNLMAMPDWIFLALLPLIITLCGQVALSPILVVVFLASVINALPVLPADPNLIVFALGAGWAMSMTASPNATATLLIAGIAKIPPTVLTWRWNGLYAFLCYMMFTISFYLLVQLVDVISPQL